MPGAQVLVIPSHFPNHLTLQSQQGSKGESVPGQAERRGQNLNPDLLTRGVGPVPPSHLEVPWRATRGRHVGSTGDREDPSGRANVTLREGHLCLRFLARPGKSRIFCRTASWCLGVGFTPRAAKGKAGLEAREGGSEQRFGSSDVAVLARGPCWWGGVGLCIVLPPCPEQRSGRPRRESLRLVLPSSPQDCVGFRDCMRPFRFRPGFESQSHHSLG